MMPDLLKIPTSPCGVPYNLLILVDDELRLIHEIVRRAKTDLAYNFFWIWHRWMMSSILPHLRTKFRRQRMDNDELLYQLIAYTLRFAKGMGVLKSRTLIVDSTHSRAWYGQKSIRRVASRRRNEFDRCVIRRVMMRKSVLQRKWPKQISTNF